MCPLLFAFSIILTTVSCQQIPGCPTRGCRPTGSFSFQMDSQSAAKVLWSRVVSEGETQHSDLGCVGNAYTLLCPVINETFRSFVSLDVLTGKTKWSEKNLNDPPLPLMDINGNIIAFDGQVLTMILSNGTVIPPVEKFEINMRPTYSLVVADDSIFVLVDSTGFLCSYDADGVIHASVWLNRTNEGAYAAIATPVIRGIRAYILTQRKSFVKSENDADWPAYRLWAIDIRPRTPPYMNTVWTFDFQTTDLAEDQPVENSHAPSDDFKAEPRVMTHKSMIENENIVFVTLSHNSKSMWFVQDKGNEYKLLSTLSSNIIAMSVNDNPTQMNTDLKFTYNIPELPPQMASKVLRALTAEENTSPETSNNVLKGSKMKRKVHNDQSLPYMWVVVRFPSGGKHPATDELMMVDPRSGETLFNPMLMDLFNGSNVRVTSEVMVMTPTGETQNAYAEPPTVVLGLNATSSNDSAVNYIAAIQKAEQVGKLLWIIPVPGNFEVKGQIAGIITEHGRRLLIAYSHKVGLGGQVLALELMSS